MALGNVFMKDTDGNIGSQIVNLTEKVCGLVFDISAQSDFWTKGQGAEIAENWKDQIIAVSNNSKWAEIDKELAAQAGN